MNSDNDQIDKKIAEAMDSISPANRATPRPFLYTRIMARMSRKKETEWERAGSFFSKPAVAIAGLCLIIGINVSVIAFKYTTKTSASTADQQLANEDMSTVASLYDIENSEP